MPLRRRGRALGAKCPIRILSGAIFSLVAVSLPCVRAQEPQAESEPAAASNGAEVSEEETGALVPENESSPDTGATIQAQPGAGAPETAHSGNGTAATEPKVAFKSGRGLVVTSADGNNELGIGVRVQVLSTIEHASGDETTQGIQLRRARLGSSGHILTRNLKYKLEIAISPRDVNTRDGLPQTSPLFDFYVDYQRFRDFNLRVGQYKVPFDRQRIISSGKLQLVDRAITDAEFTLERDIGLDLHSDDFLGLGLFRYYLGIYPGEGRNAFEQGDFGLFYLARAEIMPFGLFDDYSETDFDRTGPRLSIGAAYALLDDAPRDHGILGAAPADGGTTDIQVATADVMGKAYGLSVLSEFFWRNSRRNPGPLTDAQGAPLLDQDGAPLEVTPSRDGAGLLLQAGYLLPAWPLEIAARYSVLDGTDRPNRDGLTRLEEFAGGLSYYFAEHTVKLQTDFTSLALNGDYSNATSRLRVQLQAGF